MGTLQRMFLSLRRIGLRNDRLPCAAGSAVMRPWAGAAALAALAGAGGDPRVLLYDPAKRIEHARLYGDVGDYASQQRLGLYDASAQMGTPPSSV